jgi:hypothetical protein
LNCFVKHINGGTKNIEISHVAKEASPHL